MVAPNAGQGNALRSHLSFFKIRELRAIVLIF
jgi:hypothetical protein